jgi:hypothetical protein
MLFSDRIAYERWHAANALIKMWDAYREVERYVSLHDTYHRMTSIQRMLMRYDRATRIQRRRLEIE